jgi:hypothetical protein
MNLTKQSNTGQATYSVASGIAVGSTLDSILNNIENELNRLYDSKESLISISNKIEQTPESQNAPPNNKDVDGFGPGILYRVNNIYERLNIINNTIEGELYKLKTNIL